MASAYNFREIHSFAILLLINAENCLKSSNVMALLSLLTKEEYLNVYNSAPKFFPHNHFNASAHFIFHSHLSHTLLYSNTTINAPHSLWMSSNVFEISSFFTIFRLNVFHFFPHHFDLYIWKATIKCARMRNNNNKGTHNIQKCKRKKNNL